MSHVKSLQEEAADRYESLCRASGYNSEQILSKMDDFMAGYQFAMYDAMNLAVRAEQPDLADEMKVLMKSSIREHRPITQ